MQDASTMKHGDVAAAQPPLPSAPTPHTPYQPVSDLDVAAQYAEMEIQSVAAQFAGATMTGAAAQPPAVAAAASGAASTSEGDDADEDATEEDAVIESSSEESSDDDDDDDDESEEDRNKLRAEIEAAMEKEENKASSVPLKTANEVAAIPVREPGVELTADCPIARCGTILNVSVPGLMATIKSDMNAKPLDEGSVLCFEDRAVLGCVDEVFGPVMMPMYLVRFENAEKMPAQAAVSSVVFFATEHTTYIVPEKIADKGTDASNIFDEETDETLYSDDEAEAAAKRQNRKRNRGGNAEQPGQHTGGGDIATSEYSNNRQHNASFNEYRQGSSSGSSYGGGRGGGRGSSGRGGGRGDSSGSDNFSHNQPAPVQFQTQTHGGHTHYTQPGYAASAPPQHMGYAGQPPMGYAPPPPPTGFQPPPPMQYNPGAMQMNAHQPPPPQLPYPHHLQQPQQHYQPQHQYQQPPHMVPSYPPQAPPMPGQQQQFYQPGPPPPPQQQQQYHGAPPLQYPPQPPTGYYQNTQQQPPPPPLPPGAYDHSRQPRN
ncbi:hypothetical protein Gpo141_00001723 [Globisporangium polare]